MAKHNSIIVLFLRPLKVATTSAHGHFIPIPSSADNLYKALNPPSLTPNFAPQTTHLLYSCYGHFSIHRRAISSNDKSGE
ncbi:uncharacterized protein F5147DRAFT_683842 [Suillus discolor]|uniref:Uncharacterized protein n=1 Tax=Suillus discolor TaxID=1912936 RepID=A0A9P7FD32_9AGAM|nr:uncharacterized protein F5147DRAFT_683842 [Suillus discolor]KAG2112663.1 hypothetical protein F5147DRAFT_683842 [Suillus discolor]